VRADLDTLLTAIYVLLDDFLPEREGPGRRPKITDAELITLAVAQVFLGVGNDRQFLGFAIRRLGHLFPYLPKQPGYNKRMRALAPQTVRLLNIVAFSSPSWCDNVRLLDSTPVPCGQSRETVKRSEFAGYAAYGYCASHSRYFWGLRLHTLMAPDGTPRAMALTSPKEGEREVCLRLLARVNHSGPLTVLGDKGYAGADFEADAAALGATVVRPRRADEHGNGPHLAPLRQRIESIYWTAKDILTLERHGARTLRGLRARIASRFLALAAAISLNHELGRPSRALVDYVA